MFPDECLTTDENRPILMVHSQKVSGHFEEKLTDEKYLGNRRDGFGDGPGEEGSGKDSILNSPYWSQGHFSNSGVFS